MTLHFLSQGEKIEVPIQTDMELAACRVRKGKLLVIVDHYLPEGTVALIGTDSFASLIRTAKRWKIGYKALVVGCETKSKRQRKAKRARG